jgi:hypothetical protein
MVVIAVMMKNIEKKRYSNTSMQIGEIPIEKNFKQTKQEKHSVVYTHALLTA